MALAFFVVLGGVRATGASARLGPPLGEPHQPLGVAHREHPGGFPRRLAIARFDLILSHDADAANVARGEGLDLVEDGRAALLGEIDARGDSRGLGRVGVHVETLVAERAAFGGARAVAAAVLRQEHVSRVAVKTRNHKHAAAVVGESETW